jgi:Rad3-related DNA helicase
VCDEAHDTVDQLLGSLSCSIRRDDVSRMSQFPQPGKGMNYYLAWGHILAQRIEDKISDKKRAGKTDDNDAIRLLNLKHKVEKLKKVRQDNWVAEHKGGTIDFEPIWPGRLTESYLTRGIPRVLFTSATVTRKTMELLGIKNYTYTEYPSYFPINRRPVYYIPSSRVDHKAGTAEINAWLAKIDQIVGSRPNTKGIIHAVSYDRCKRIVHSSSYGSRMIMHDSSTTQMMVERFKGSTEPKILVSPSVVTGFDFPYDMCRWMIIAKVPFPDGRSEAMQARTKIDPDYGMYLTTQAVIQACGRGMRAPDDQCEVFLIDSHWEWFSSKYRRLMQNWFLQSVKKIALIPEDPNEKKK